MTYQQIFLIMLTGIGASLLMDLWTVFQKRVLKLAALNYALAGRWVLWMCRGRFRHQTIVTSPALRGETATGWFIHYMSGAVLAFIPPCIAGERWLYQPDIISALMAGIISLAVPFLVMQPALGFGIAAAKTPHPLRARLLSLVIHLVYGCGLYLSMRLLNSPGY